jgi:hypothetical protein
MRPSSTSWPPNQSTVPMAPKVSSVTTAESSALAKERCIAVSKARRPRCGVAAAILRLVAARLHGADGVQGLVDVGADVADAILAERDRRRTR